MTPFTVLHGVAAPLPILNIDTDMIIPKQFLKTIKRTGLGQYLFHEMRQDIDGNSIDDFILNQPAYASSSILITGANMGCGSSREHAPWALADFGIRCIIAPSFADIFFNNCFKNGILPIVLPEKIVENLQQVASEPQAWTVDLKAQNIVLPSSEKINFDVDPFRKNCLINGLDDIALTLQQEEKITGYEEKRKTQLPWLWGGSLSTS